MSKKTKKGKKEPINIFMEKYEKLADGELFQLCKEILLAKSLAIKNKKKSEIQVLSDQYEALLITINNRNLYEHTTSDINSKNYKYYPDYGNTNFNNLILQKKEFYIHKSELKNKLNSEESEKISKKLCDPLFDSITGERVTDKSKIIFNLTNSQKFLKTFMSPHTPYNSLLIFHGTGVGKTCTSISIAEQYSEQLKVDGKKIIILLNQSIKENFIKNIFNIQKMRANMPYYQCTGADYLKYIPDYKTMSIEDIQKRILKIIKSKYDFYGYQKFANMINNLEAKIKSSFSEDVYPKVFANKLHELFSDTVMIIDEAHNIKEGDNMKVLPPILNKVVSIVKNMKLLLLSATPMFDNATEIIWLMNLLLKNDNRPTMKMDDFFDSNGKIKQSKIAEFKQKTRGLVSYVRGENPLRFPERLYPTGSKILTPDKLPTKTADDEEIEEEDRIKELVFVDCKMNGLQQSVYDNMIESTDGFGAFKQPGLMCSNIVFPNEDRSGSAKRSGSRSSSVSHGSGSAKRSGSHGNAKSTEATFNIGEYISDAGFQNVAEKSKKNDRIIFNIKNNIFTEDRLGEYSSKIKSMIECIRKSEGIAFIYSQFINSGVIPIALALEHAGYSKYGGSLLEKEVKPSLGKYIIISGMNDLSKNAYKNYLKIENDNRDGKQVKIIIGSETASEGLDFRFIRSVHILEPWFHLNKLDQVIGRAIRNCSHIDLPLDKRNVTVYFYIANSSTHKNRESLDLSIYREAEKKAQNMSEIEYILKTNAVDCSINKSNNIFPNDKDYSRRCNYKKCNYTCDGIENDKLTEGELNYDTINFDVLGDIINDVLKILKIGNTTEPPLFTTKNSFSLNEIINYIGLDTLGSLLGLHKLIVTREIIKDKNSRDCYLEYKNGNYIVVPKIMSNTLFTLNDLTVKPYKRTKKIELQDSLLSAITQQIHSSKLDTSKLMVDAQSPSEKKTKKQTPTEPKTVIKQVIKTIKKSKNIIEKYKSVYPQLLNDIIHNSSIKYLDDILNSNSSKEIYDEDGLKSIFNSINYGWLDYLDPLRKKVVCEVLIYKFFNNKLSLVETDILEQLYNIMTFEDVYFKDLSFKGDLKKIWGYKLANSERKIEYYRWVEDINDFKIATSEEVQYINKSILKKNKTKPPLEAFNLVGYIELKKPQNTMMFKIRDKRKEGKKGTQIKTGSVCNNDGMKKNKIIEFISYLIEDDSIYKDTTKRNLPSKDLLCIQLETYLRYSDLDKKKRYFYNYEETVEYKLTEKKSK